MDGKLDRKPKNIKFILRKVNETPKRKGENMKKQLIALLAVTLLVFLSGVVKIEAKGLILDATNTTEGWNVYNAEDATVELESVPGEEGEALGVAYDIGSEGWIGIYKDNVDLSNCKSVKLVYRGKGSSNTIEFKLEDVDGSNFGIILKTKSNVSDWTTVEVPMDDLTYWWGGDESLDNLSNVKLHFAISKKQEGDEGGSGKIAIDRIELIE